MRKFYAFTLGKPGTEFWCYKEFLKKLEIDKSMVKSIRSISQKSLAQEVRQKSDISKHRSKGWG